MKISLSRLSGKSFGRLVLSVLFAVSMPVHAVDMLVSNFTDTPDPAVRGGNIVYTATITNNATDVAHGVKLVYALDPDTAYVSNSGGCVYASGPHTVTCSYATVNGDTSGPNSADFLTVNVTVASKASAGATVGISATVSTTDVDTAPGNNTLNQLTTLGNGADMSLSLSANPTTVAASGTLTYTAAVTNLGPNSASNVAVAVTLSPNVTYQSAGGSGWTCGASGQVVTCTRASGAVGTLPDISIGVKQTGAVTGTITTTGVVTISGSATDYNNSNDSSTANVTVTTGTDLAITKTASTATPASGQAMSFTLLPRNLGPFAATSVAVTDTLPAGFSGIGASGTGWSCGVAGQTVTCTAASYAVGASNNITVTATAPTVLSTTPFTNTAQITSATPDPHSGNDSGSASVTVLPDGVDLSITKSRSPNPVAQGSNITNTLRVANAGPRNAVTGEVTVTDTLPAGESYVSYSGSNWTCGAVGQIVTCTYNASLAVGGSSSNLVLTTTAVNAGTLTNSACVSYTNVGGQGYTDPVSGNNCVGAGVSSTVSSNAIDLQVAKTVSVDPLAWNASSLDYTLTITNAGPGDATGVVLTDVIPGYKSGATGIVASRTGGTSTATFNCTNGSTVTCTQTGGTIAAGTTAVFTITVARPMYDSSAQPGGKWTNTASVTSTDQGDTDLSNNSASVQVKVDPVADVRIQNTATPASAQAGTNATYVLTVNNAGPSTAKSVTVTDVFTIPVGTMTFISATPSAGSCAAFNAGTNTLTCSLGDIAEGGTATVTIVVRPDYMSLPPSPRTITNDATVSMTTPDSNTANNTAQSVLTVTQASLDLLVNLSDSPDPLGFVPASAGPVFPDNVVTYRNAITNRGPSVASGFVLTYAMTPPAGKKMTFLGDKLASTGQAYSNYCNNLNSQVTGPATLTITCTFPGNFILLGNNATTDLYLDFRVDTQPAPTGDAFASTVSITSSEPDSVAGNNSASQTTTVRMRSDLQLAKSARAFISGSDAATSTVQVRQPFYWVLTLTNAGPGDSQITQITDTLPAGVTLYTGGTVAPYNAAPYNSGITWSTNNGTPTSGTCSGTTTLTCNIGLLESGKVAVVRVPVVSTTTGARNNCASATTSEVDPNSANNTTICSSVTVQASSIAGTVYSDLDNSGTKGGAEPGINSVSLTLTGTDDYGNAVSRTATTNASGNFSFATLSPGSYALTETQPAAYQDGKDTAGSAGGTITGNGTGTDSISGISLAANTAATGYLFGELANATISGYVFVDLNSNAMRNITGVPATDESAGITGITISLTGTDDLGAVSATATTGANGSYSFSTLRPGTYQVQEATIVGVTHTGMTVGSKGGQDGATVIGANTAVPGATKRTVSNITVAAGDAAQNYNFGESGQGLSGYVYVDLNNNGIKDAGEPGIAGVSVTLSGTTSGGGNVCAAISPNPCTVTTGTDGAYSFAGLPASNGSGYTLTEQSQASAPLSNYTDGAESMGSLGGSAAVNDAFSGIVISLGQFGQNYNFGERAGTISGAVYYDKNDNGVRDAGETGIGSVMLTLSGTTASGANVCTILTSCTTTTAADGTFSFTGLPASNGSGYSLTETQPVYYADRTNTAGTGGGTASVVGGNSVFSGIALAAGSSVSGYLFGEKTGTLSGFVYNDANNNGAKNVGENGIAGVTVTLSGTTASGVNVCSVISGCTATTAADGSYSFTNVPNANVAGYTLTEQAQNVAPLSTYVDGMVTAGSNCGGCTTVTTSPNRIQAIPFSAANSFSGYNFAELSPASISGRVYVDLNGNGTYDAGEELGSVTLTLTGIDDLGTAVNRTVTTASNGGYSITMLRPSNGAGYVITETQPASYGDYPAATGTERGTIGGLPTGTAAQNVISAIVLPLGGSAINYNFREMPPTGSISGFVYVDANENGVKDGGEVGIAGVTVKLTGIDVNGNAASATTTTAADGRYSFNNLPASNGTGYTITEIQPLANTDRQTTIALGNPGTLGGGKPIAAGGNDIISGIVFVAGASLTNYNFGESPPGGTISGFVYGDTNDNGVKDAGETGIAGVTVKLTGTDYTGAAVNRSITTAADGSFTFAIVPASGGSGYVLTETQPSAYRDGKTSVASGNPGNADSGKPVGVGNHDRITNIVLTNGADFANYLFGEVPLPTLKPPIVNGYVWMDRAHNRMRPLDGSLQGMPNWTVRLEKSGALICTVSTDSNGFYQFDNLHCPGHEASGLPTGSGYTIVFNKDGNNLPAVPISGNNRGDVPAGGGSRITNITLNANDHVSEQNLPLDPAGIIYDSMTRQPVAGAAISISGPPGFDPATHLVGGTFAMSQTVGSDGMYQFLLQNGFPSGVYTLTVNSPAGYLPAPSSRLPACVGPLTVGLVPTPALVQASDPAPAANVPMPASPSACAGIVPGGAATSQYYFSFVITNGGSAPILNNHIPIDPLLPGMLLVTKTTPKVNVARGDLVPYTITVTNTQSVALPGMAVRDQMPPGFKYRTGSGRLNGAAAEPAVSGRLLSWNGQNFAPQEKKTYTLVLTVGSGVGDGDYVNQAFAAYGATGAVVSNMASAIVRVIPDATFDCPDVIGKVFDDRNANGYQDDGEPGIPNVRLATPRGLLVTTDAEGRFHVPCADIPNQDRGSNFVMKLDDRTLPSGYRLTTENPADVRITRGKMVKMNFGATVHRVVRIEMEDAAFEAGKTDLKAEWRTQIDALMEQLKAKPSVVRIAYQRGAEQGDLAAKRVEALQEEIRKRWKEMHGMYTLVIETEGVQ
ncbi:putative repeat protein (TIGR01451 family) [Paucimonas lemoignei]|uniref:Putative repeat protein (TIGR01451 family) n=1 Tax=Paucimonas lemoignei TaxID=29443 RepID=A0A4R3HUU3_PAULE|nr:SdrD B-like domain-containing protein [Paucimonas lemoignei]TCS36504.1 putative repeat protein (TIGR01451 family) [Paucimonas lemoignei]